MDLNALYKLSYGMYVVCSFKGNKLNGQIANTLFQVTNEPPMLAVSLNKINLTCDFVRESKVFSASVLSKETPLKFIGHFGFKSGRNIDKFSSVNFKYTVGKSGAPIVLENSLAFVEVCVEKEIDMGSHILFIGKLLEAEIIKEGEPMTYDYYHEVKRGGIPKTAPHYIEREIKKVNKYRCLICNYVYDPRLGDPDSGVKPGTPFEDLPEDWFCPICGAGKDQFIKES
ncbi:MAG: rubredoxin [Synergistetes bacterium]|nr:rubredoxin [Synergistota bacterium]MCX8127481.1 rubredoxin [Synergistota bacterium]MDW8192742.1 rubredoxin [Synergistota bacterium]